MRESYEGFHNSAIQEYGQGEQVAINILYTEALDFISENYPERVDAFNLIFGSEIQELLRIDAQNINKQFFFNALKEVIRCGEVSNENAEALERNIAFERGGLHGTLTPATEDSYVLKVRNFMWGIAVGKYRRALAELSPEWRSHQRLH